MTVQPGRKLEGLTFDQVEAEVKRELEVVQPGEEFLLGNILISRSMNIATHTAADFLTSNFSRDQYRAEDWVFWDTNLPPLAVIPKIDVKTFTKDEVHTVIAQVIGRWYYNNADSHKIVPDILKRLGFE